MKKTLFYLISIFFISTSLYSFDKVALSYGYKDNIDITGISIIKDIDYRLIDKTDISLEFSAEYANGKKDDLYILSIQPLLSYNFTDSFYGEVGLGIAQFSETNLDKKKFGIHFQFKESVGFGYRFTDNFEATLKYNHYSNSDIDNENSGLDFVALRAIYRF